ncbi:MAG: T9SS type A sorting domain-containing protein, partial [Bacteroidia bacterium]|nr:T9SS type A sorting domain-containing protein [Bacteroidia bacterium]
YASRVNAPALSDLDNDGDMDILAFSISGSWVEHHENFSMDSSGVPGLLNHHNIPVCWGYFVLSNSSNVAVLPPVLPTCPLMPADPYRLAYAADEGTGQGTPATAEQHKLRHAGSSLLAFDKDGDGDKDILNGDILSPNLLYLENCGTPDSAWICAQDTAYPSYNVPAILRDVAGPHYFDGNNDGNKDLIVSNFYFTGEDFYNVMYYRNTTNNQSNVFSHQTSRWLVDGMVEVGTGAHPAFFDVDQDGRTDLLVGNDFYFNNNNQVAKIAYYRNTGSGQKAEYTLVTDDFAGISSTGLLGLYPAFADLDGDADPDMLLGTSDGTLVYYQNIAGAGNPCIFILSQPVYQSIDIGDNASPQLVDVNRDGDTDLLIGERSGVLNYYENTGTAAVPVFSYVTNNFGGVNVTKAGSFAGFSTPLLFDNGNGYELISGSLNGHLYHYGNIDGNLGGSFTLLDSMFQNIYEPQVAVPAMADVDGDTLYDLVVGTLPGGLVLYTQNPLLSVHHPEDAGSFFTVYPNPVESWLNLRMETGSGRKTIEVFDVRGQMVSRLEVYGDAPRLDVRQLNRGMYLCRVSVKGKTFSQRFVKQ